LRADDLGRDFGDVLRVLVFAAIWPVVALVAPFVDFLDVLLAIPFTRRFIGYATLPKQGAELHPSLRLGGC
jgi:hypothetical protein